MIVQVMKNGQEYRLILSTICKYMDNIDVYKSCYDISAFYTIYPIINRDMN